MHEPDDFGFNPAQTLAHVGLSTPPSGFGPFWANWTERVGAAIPEFTPIDAADEERAGAPGVTHFFESTRGVRVGCRVTPPAAGPARAVVVTSHGYQVAPGEALADTSPGSDRDEVATIVVRVRGYPGSQFDTGDLTAHPTGYITYGLESIDTWVIGDAVADVVNACRAASEMFDGARLFLHGESFGGGLGVVAASVLGPFVPCERLLLGLPTLGDWNWRLSAEDGSRARYGSGRQVAEFIARNRADEESIIQTLRHFDAVVHAARVSCPTICKLALRDEVVPAPTAAAVFNALGTSPGLKWRFLTRYGHFDGGVADVRRHAMFERLCTDFVASEESPGELMRRWEAELAGDLVGPIQRAAH